MSNKNYKTGVTPNPLPLIEEAGGVFSFFDHTNPDINLFNMVDEEMIRISGSELLYYAYMQSDSQFDEVYMEERNKPIAVEPIVVFGHYEPKVIEENLSQFGIELTNDQIFIFNKSYIETKLKGNVKPGDIIQPRFQNQKYEVFEVQEDSFEIYGVYHLVCSAKLLRDSDDVQDTPLTDVSDPIVGVESTETLEDSYDGN